MCSFSWRQFDDHIGIAFNRDESNLRAKAIPPKVYQQQNYSYVMPIDPDAGGSWLSCNQSGFVFVLLNNYQGTVKPKTQQLISRGIIVKSLAKCKTQTQVGAYLKGLDLVQFQAFSLLVISDSFKSMWRHDGDDKLVEKPLPNHWFSSAHPQANDVLKQRKKVSENWPIESDEDLILLHQSHLPNNEAVDYEDKTFSICMHHDKGQSQSLSYIKLFKEKAEIRYWDGQPCQTQQYLQCELNITNLGQIVLAPNI